MTTFDNPDEFTRDDAILLQAERINQAVEGVSATVSKIEAILDRIEQSQSQLAADMKAALDG